MYIEVPEDYFELVSSAWSTSMAYICVDVSLSCECTAISSQRLTNVTHLRSLHACCRERYGTS